MDFCWTSAQCELHEAAIEAGTRIAASHERDEEGFCSASWRAASAFGLAGLDIPLTFGGLGLDALTTARVLEGFGEGHGRLGLAFSAAPHPFACCGPIANAASPAMRERTLPPLARGEWIGANAITESQAGS